MKTSSTPADDIKASQNINGKHRLITKFKQTFTKILEKLNTINPLNLAKSFSTQRSVGIGVKNINYEKTNPNNAKEQWQKDLITKRTKKEAWGKLVGDDLKTNSHKFDKIFSREEGIFPLNKLSKTELSEVANALGKPTSKDSLELKTIKTFFLKSTNISKEEKYQYLRNLEEDFFNHLKGFTNGVITNLPNANDEQLSNCKEALQKIYETFSSITRIRNAFGEDKHTTYINVKSEKDIIHNFNIKFTLAATRYTLLLKRAFESLEERKYQEFQNTIDELKKYLTNQEGMSEDMEKIRGILFKNKDKKSIKIPLLAAGSYDGLKNYIDANSI